MQSDTKVGGSKDELEAARKAGRSGGGAVSARLAQLKQKSEAEKPAAPSRGANGKVEEVEEQFKDPASRISSATRRHPLPEASPEPA